MSSFKGIDTQTMQAAKIVRSRELDSFATSTLLPDQTSYRIVWISGIGGIGKSILLEQLRGKTHEDDFSVNARRILRPNTFDRPSVLHSFEKNHRAHDGLERQHWCAHFV